MQIQSSSSRNNGASPTGTTQILAGKLFDSLARKLLTNQLITVSPESGLILSVEPLPGSPSERDELASRDGSLDLRGYTVLPGLVDAHVHMFLHPYAETSWNDQVTKESIVERTVRATVHARDTLMAGYTSVRDLGTEGAGDADIHLRKCLSGPDAVIPGPRYFCANRAIVCTGAYGPKSSIHVNQDGVEGVTGAEVADGKDGCIAAVRRQIAAGADWIKIYTDYSVRSRLVDVAPKRATAYIPMFNDEELEALITTAHSYGVKVAAHVVNQSTIHRLISLGVDSIEHGSGLTISDTLYPHDPRNAPRSLDGDGPSTTGYDAIPLLAQSNIFWVPTLAVYHTTGGEKWEQAAKNFQTALKHPQFKHVKIACGGDTGPFPHGDNALELKLMVRLGAAWQDVLSWATLGGWECIRPVRSFLPPGSSSHGGPAGDNEVAFGLIGPGRAADIIAVAGDLEKDFEAAVDKSSVKFVMKGGRVYKDCTRECTR